MNVVFRTDASFQIGTGHVMRCLTLADALRKRGCECRFISREHLGNLNDLIYQRGYTVCPLSSGIQMYSASAITNSDTTHASWLGADWVVDAEQTKVGIGGTVVDWLIVDHYALDFRWETLLRPHCGRIMVIDDLADRNHKCDLLLDQNLVADMSHRYNGLTSPHCILLLGPKYALLQVQYAEQRHKVQIRKGSVRKVLVYFGGADVNNLTGMVISAFISLGCDTITLDVVLHDNSPYVGTISEQVKGIENIHLHTGLPSLASLMLEADIAIGAGGATSWERCCFGLPTLVITLADNQKPVAAEMEMLGLIRLLGHKDEVDEALLMKSMQDMFKAELLPDWSERCTQYVDGQGAERVCDYLLNVTNQT